MNNENLVIKPKKAKGDDGYKVFSIRIKEKIVTQIDDISARTGHSRNELIGAFFRIRFEQMYCGRTPKQMKKYRELCSNNR